ncbi:4-alpha-glucanotransferase [Anaeromyxobacter oryzae]|uniref:4-alpha-glucanotransferase n=1 Tax=Anaeromyxobacter oryzae TaxID=2918170 RepID=A0ABN6MWJ0_9BACT|nr:4-alpha-glucanotransferase [Anaeromyxobacter oryzae]BDG03883.1 4-alpha-glucanotransferase [Anaeromyxobacter oryzae]
MSRQAGVLLPLFSLRSASDWGVGEIPDLVPFTRWARDAGFSIVQILPVNEASRGQNSPYGALSAFALDPVYIAPSTLEDFEAAGGEGALPDETRRRLDAVRAAPSVRWDEVRALKRVAFDLAFERFVRDEWNRRTGRARALEAFAREEADWLDEYTLFVALHDREMGGRGWTDWPAPLANRDPAALADARARLSREILFHTWLQWQGEEQWHAARHDANAGGVLLGGDLPFMVATDSADVWSRRGDFRLDARVGVPPDAFSATGQDWGLPVYRWDVMEREGHVWLRARARRMADLYDLYRVDHVVGVYRTYFFPNDGGKAAFVPDVEAAQTHNGETVLGLLGQDARVIAEDLGVVPDFVRASLQRLEIPGYRVQRWEKEWKAPGEPFRDPARWPALSVATTGTHDTESVADWYEAMSPQERAQLLEIPALAPLRAEPPARFDDRVRDALLGMIYGSGSDLLLLPFQDVFGLRERVNVPGTVTDANWTYRIPMDLAALAADRAARERLRGLAVASGRAAG